MLLTTGFIALMLAQCGTNELAEAAAMYARAVALDESAKDLDKQFAQSLPVRGRDDGDHYVALHRRRPVRDSGDDSYNWFYWEYALYMKDHCGWPQPQEPLEEPLTLNPYVACDAETGKFGYLWEATAAVDNPNHLLAMRSHTPMFESRDGGTTWGYADAVPYCLTFIEAFFTDFYDAGPLCFGGEATFGDVPVTYCRNSRGAWQAQGSWTDEHQWLESVGAPRNQPGARYGMWVRKGHPTSVVFSSDEGLSWRFDPSSTADDVEIGGTLPDGQLLVIQRDLQNHTGRLAKVDANGVTQAVAVPWETRNHTVGGLLVNADNPNQIRVMTALQRTGDTTTWLSDDAARSFHQTSSACDLGAFFSDAEGTIVCLELGPQSGWGILQIWPPGATEARLLELPGMQPRLLWAGHDHALLQWDQRLIRLSGLRAGTPVVSDITPQ